MMPVKNFRLKSAHLLGVILLSAPAFAAGAGSYLQSHEPVVQRVAARPGAEDPPARSGLTTNAGRKDMQTREVAIERVSVVSSRPFEEVISRLTATIGHPDMAAFQHAIREARNADELADVVHRAIGPSELMEFIRFDMGEILRKATGGERPKSVRFIVGNPLIMKEMLRTVPDAGSYAPVTILVDERVDGVHLSYDTMASLLAPYGAVSAQVVARDLDEKVKRLLEMAAR